MEKHHNPEHQDKLHAEEAVIFPKCFALLKHSTKDKSGWIRDPRFSFPLSDLFARFASLCTTTWWLGLLEKRVDSQKKPQCFCFCLSTPLPSPKKSPRFYVIKPALLTNLLSAMVYSVRFIGFKYVNLLSSTCIFAKFLLLPMFKHFLLVKTSLCYLLL